MKFPLVAMLAVVLAVSTGCNSKDDVKVPEEDLTPEKVEIPETKQEIKPVQKSPVKLELVKPAEPIIQDGPAANLDGVNFVNDTATKNTEGTPIDPSEGDSFTDDGNTYYYIDGVWTHEDFVNPYSK